MTTAIRKHALGSRLTALLLAAILLLSLSLTARAAGSTQVEAYLRPDYTIIIDGSQRTFYNVNGKEVHPLLYGGSTYLPVRAIGELMGKNVDWNQSTLTVTLAGSRTTGTVSGTPDANPQRQTVTAYLHPDFTIIVDGVEQTFTNVNGKVVYPLLYSGSTYLPIRAIGQLMGKTVSWNEDTLTVTLADSAPSGSDSLVTDADSFSDGTTPSGLISAEQAKNKALAHAGLSASQVTFVRATLEWDDGRQVYDVEFYTSDYKEYDYEIDAASGAVLSFDYDADHYTAPSSGSYISEARAREIALSYVDGASASHVVKLKLDRDDGRAVYEVEIVYNAREYEFEIDASSGRVLEWDSESIYH